MKQIFILFGLFFIFSCTEEKKFDTIIRNGTIYDGSGKEGFTGDIGINGDTIAFIGDLKNARDKLDSLVIIFRCVILVILKKKGLKHIIVIVFQPDRFIGSVCKERIPFIPDIETSVTGMAIQSFIGLHFMGRPCGCFL